MTASSELRVATFAETGTDTSLLGARVVDALRAQLGARPQLVLVVCTEEHPLGALVSLVRAAFPAAAVAGTTTAVGLLTHEGYMPGPAVGAFGLVDPEGAFGVCLQRLGDDPRAAAQVAVARAIAAAGREGELPEAALMMGVAGAEEQLLMGIEDVVGPQMPVLGGSAGDNDFAGRWMLAGPEGTSADAVVVVALFPSRRLRQAHRSGFVPTALRGRVTRAAGRRIYEIDGEPAGPVYDRWTEGSMAPALAPEGSVMAQTTLSPLGRQIGTVNRLPIYALTLPVDLHPDGSMDMLTEVETGEELVLMEGTADGLAARMGRVTTEAIQGEPVVGGITIHCVGYALVMRKDISEVVGALRARLGPAPVLGWFTFGEQGPRMDRPGNLHANLMTSAVMLTREGLLGDGELDV